MEKRCITAPNAPPAMGPYSHAVAAGNLLFISGQGPLDPAGTGVIKGTFEEETRLTLSNLQAVLEDAGSSLRDVIKVMIFLADMDNFREFNKVYKEFFSEDCPARSCVEVARLPADFQVEIEAIAILPEEG
jgi:2-iminobutanoate/2-iminopropanoate deaminase